LRTWLILALVTLFHPPIGERECGPSLWKSDIVARYHFRTFNTAEKNSINRPRPFWRNQQGIAYISQTVIAVYQVQESKEIPHLESREESGGGGRYSLQIVFLNSTDGVALKTFHIITSGSLPSQLYPTHDGRFLVRTGQIVRSYSPEFQEISSKRLPPDSWSMSVSPSGRLFSLEHYAQEKHSKMVTIFDSETLDEVVDPRPSDVAFWPAGSARFPELLKSLPPKPGVFNADGSWQSFDYSPKNPSCRSSFARLTDQLFAGYGCKELKLFSVRGELLWNVPMKDRVVNVIGEGTLVAAEIEDFRANPLDLDLSPSNPRIIVYDLDLKSSKCLISRVSSDSRGALTIFYAFSPVGDLAVIEESYISLYHP
jgi:hypothetical protein